MLKLSALPSRDVLQIAIGVIVVTLLLFPYATNGFWFDDALNSQIYSFLQRVNGGLGEFSYRVVLHWLQDEGRLMLGFFYGYAGFYVFNDLTSLRLAHCTLIGINMGLYGYMLWLLGANRLFLIVWAILLAGLFQIHGAGLDPVAGFAFHYPMLGIQLGVALILLVKWHLEAKAKYFYWAIFFWFISMLCYETNLIFVPIAFALLLVNRNANKKLPGILLICATLLYFVLTFYIKSHASNASYAGSSFGVFSKMLPAYLKQLSASLPLSSYWAATHNSLSLGPLIKNMLSSALAWAVFFLSLLIFASRSSETSSIRKIKNEAAIISLGMFLLPAIFPAISQRYQSEVSWGIGTLPVYYQNFGLAFFATWLLLFILSKGKHKLTLAILASLYLAFNVTLNSAMANLIDSIWREPRETFAAQAKAGLFSRVQDGDIIHLKSVNNYVNSNLIFEWTGKRVYIPNDDHYWYPEKPRDSARNFELSRGATGDYQLIEISAPTVTPAVVAPPLIQLPKNKVVYHFIAPQEPLVKVLDNFPAALPLIEIQLGLKEAGSVDSIYVSAPNGLGEWTTLPSNNLWGIGIIEKSNGLRIRNAGGRKENLTLPIGRNLILWLPDNGNLSECPELYVELILTSGKRVAASANCLSKLTK